MNKNSRTLQTEMKQLLQTKTQEKSNHLQNRGEGEEEEHELGE